MIEHDELKRLVSQGSLPPIVATLIAENEALRKDAERYRWLCDGNGYFMEEQGLCGHSNEKDKADLEIDITMSTGARP